MVQGSGADFSFSLFKKKFNKHLRVVAHLTHTWLLRGHISKTTCTIDFKLHMAIKQLSNTTHTKNEEARSNSTGAMKF